MLYMHLSRPGERPMELEAVGRSAEPAPWLQTGPSLEVTVGKLNVRNAPAGKAYDRPLRRGETVVATGEPTEAEGYRWREVDVPGVVTPTFVATEKLSGRSSGRSSDDSGEESSGDSGGDSGAAPRFVSEQGPPIDDETLQALKTEQVVALDRPVAAGEMLWWTGTFGLPEEEIVVTGAYKRAPTLHWEVFAGEKAFGHENGEGDGSEVGAWMAFEDKNEDHRFTAEEAGAADQLQDLWDESEHTEVEALAGADAEERTPFYILEDPTLRRVAAKFRSEWAVKNIETVMADAKGFLPEDRTAMKKMQWWKEAAEETDPPVDLPSDASVWHYHPVGALETLPPRFTAEGDRTSLDGTAQTIQNVAEKVIAGLRNAGGSLPGLNDDQFERVRAEMHGMSINVAAPATEEPEHFANVYFVQSKYGHVSFNGSNYALGIFATSTGENDPDLYEMLEGDNPIEGVPGQTPVEGASEDPMEWFGDRERAIWASITESEGSLKALNTYDTAFLSVGPVQQTAGAGEAKGELQGALDTLKRNAPETYWRHFGRFGLQPVASSIQAGAKKAHFKLRGEVLDTAEKKERLRSFNLA
jgi:hypothetical protein